MFSAETRDSFANANTWQSTAKTDAKAAELKKELDSAQDKLAAAEKQIKSLKKAAGDASSEADRLKRENKSLRAGNESLSAELLRRKRESELLGQEFDRLAKDRDSACREADSLAVRLSRFFGGKAPKEKSAPEKEKTDGGKTAAEIEAKNADIERLRRELAAAEADKKTLRDELIDILDKFNEQDAASRRIKLGLASGFAGTLNTVPADEHETALMFLRENSEKGCRFAAQAAGFADYVAAALSKPQTDNPGKATVKLRAAELKAAAEKYSGTLTAGGEFAAGERRAGPPEFRILSLNSELKVAVINSGYAGGVRTGLRLYGGPGGKTALRVIATRMFVSAALVAEGDFNSLSTGEKLSLGAGGDNRAK